MNILYSYTCLQIRKNETNTSFNAEPETGKIMSVKLVLNWCFFPTVDVFVLCMDKQN